MGNKVASVKQLEALRQRVLSASSLYDVMGIPVGADAAAIKDAHRSLARSFHPDRSRLEDAGAVMAVINVAYSTLSDPKQRKAYDTVNRTKDASCPRCGGAGHIFKQKGFKSKVRVECPICGGGGRAQR